MRRRALALSLLLAAICAVAFVLRCSNAATVLVGDAVVFAENDPYYHMRRVFQILAHYPTVPAFDPWIDFPRGAAPVFAPLFDLGIATLVKLAGLGAGDRMAVETLAAFVPPVLGALTCLPLFWLAAQATTVATALLAAALCALVPAHIWYSRLGFVDHHVAVTLVQVTTAALVLRALGVGRAAAGEGDRARRATCVVLATLALAAGVLMWNGYLLLVAVLDVFLVALFVASDPARRVIVARLVAATHLGAALLVVPGALDVVRATGAPLSSVYLSFLHVGLLASTGAVAWIAAAATGRGWALRRIAALASAVAAAVLVGLLVQRSALVGVLRWLSASDPFMGAVQESVSILRRSDGGLDLAGPQVWMTRFFLVVPLLLAVLGFRLVRGRRVDEGRLFVLVWAALLFGLTVLQRRFAETAAPAMAVLVADALVDLAGRLRRSLVARRVPGAVARAVSALAIVVAVVLAVWPYYRGLVADPGRLTVLGRVPLRPGAAAAFSSDDLAAQRDSEDVRLGRSLARFAALLDRTESPEERARPRSGVMNPWPLGHKLLYVARTPVTATPFGSYVGGSSFSDAVDFFLATDERQALAILARRGSRWVVVDEDLGTIGASIVGRGENPRDYYGRDETADGVTYTFRPPLLRSLYFRLTRLAGSQFTLRGADGATEVVPALDHFRLVVDAASDDEGGNVEVYEVVTGAVAVVHTAPGAEVTASYAFRSDAGRDRVYEKTVLGDASGVARVVLPYSSERPDLGQTASWHFASAGRRGELRPAERDVREGRELPLDLR